MISNLIIGISFDPTRELGRILHSAKAMIDRRAAIACLVMIFAMATTSLATAQTINIGSSTDLNNAIHTIDNNPTSNYTLNFINGFTMSQQVPDITSNSAIT